MIEFRSHLNRQVNDLILNNEIGKTSIDALSSVQKSLDDDMAAFAKSHGAEAEWRAANEFYSNTVGQFKKGKLKNLVNEKSSANFDEQSAWKYLVSQTTNPTRARKMFQSLDAKGREAVRAGLLSEAVEASTREGSPFSPARFAGFLEKREEVWNQFFRGDSKEQLGGLIRLMRHIERAGQFAENPPTGQRLLTTATLVGTAGAGVVEPVSAATVLGSSLTLKGLFQTKTGRNLLLAANKATEGSKEFDKILEAVVKTASRSSNQQDQEGNDESGN